MKMAVRCRCGKLQGEVDTQGVAARATCYCKDCQAYARFLAAQPDFLDDAGGTDVAASLPATLRFIQGVEHLGCMSLSNKGIYRWYATCCRTPIGNTPRDPRVAYVGLVRAALAEPDLVLDEQIGPRSVALNTESATRPVKSTPARSAWAIVKIIRMIVGARLSGRYLSNPFFDQGRRLPVVAPQVLTAEERAALG
jgi:hypothetical protein